jgi:dTDP-4-amino-4,6-dideoxygalactose transaminase
MSLKIRVGDFQLTQKEKKAIMDVLDSNRITEGVKTARFEDDFSKYIGVEHTVLVNSGTSALITGLNSIKHINSNVKEDSYVITSPLTYVATSNAVRLTGLVPRFVDVDPNTFNITPEKIKEELDSSDDSSEYSIILPVHLMGYPAEMDEINTIAKKNYLDVFEDSAQAHGSKYKGKICGSMSTASSFSFYVAHNIQVGEMGALCTNNPDIATYSRRFKANGRMCDCKTCTRAKGTCPKLTINPNLDPRFTHTEIGYNFKTSDIMAAIGIEQLKKAEQIMLTRYQNVKHLNEELDSLSDKIQLPILSNDVSYLAYPIVIKDKKINREKITRKLEQHGVETRPLFNCIPLQQPAYAHMKKDYEDKLPNAKYIGQKGFYIGCHQYLKQEDLEYITKIFKQVF